MYKGESPALLKQRPGSLTTRVLEHYEMAHKSLDGHITAEQLRDVIDYDAESGVFRWRHRPDRSLQWNGRYAGKPAGAIIRGYVRIVVGSWRFAAHRLAWLFATGEWPTLHIDHIDGDPTNNAFRNLRPATRSQNLGNLRRHKDNRSGLKGATWNARNRKWYSQIMVARKVHHLGYYDTAEAAHAAYCEAAVRLRGAFANAG